MRRRADPSAWRASAVSRATFISRRRAAELLGVSESTVKRISALRPVRLSYNLVRYVEAEVEHYKATLLESRFTPCQRRNRRPLIVNGQRRVKLAAMREGMGLPCLPK